MKQRMSAPPPRVAGSDDAGGAHRGSGVFDFFRYHGVLAPGVRAFRNMRFRTKALWISVAFLVPIGLLVAESFGAKARSLADTAKERDGVAFARDLLPAIKHARQLRRFTMKAVTDGQAPPELAEVRSQLTQDLARLRADDARFGDSFGTHEVTAAVDRALADAAPASAGLFKVFASHGRVGAALVALVEKVADGSGLTLDPELSTYYLMDAGLTSAPVLLEQTARMRVLASAAAASGQGVNAAAELARQDGLAEYMQEQLRADLAKVVGLHPDLKAELDASAALSAATALRDIASLPPASKPDPDEARRIDEVGGTLVTALEKVQQSAIASLDRLLAERESATRRSMTVTAAILCLSMALATYLFYAFAIVMSGGIDEVKRHLRLMSDGDLTSSPTPWGRDDAADLMLALRETQQSMRDIVTQVRGASQSIVVSSTEIASGAVDLSARTEHGAANLQQSAAAMEHITGTVRRTSDNARDASRLAAGNEAAASRGGEVIGRMVATMEGIDVASRRIGDIIGTIDGIAFQTNILALNAAVEAARAGESGRGFAVVASEVRSLAHRSSEAAREIKSLITASLAQVNQGSEIVKLAGGTMGEIVETSQSVNRLLAEIATRAEEQTLGVTQTTQAVQDLDHLTQQNASLVEQTAAAAASLKAQADKLAAEVARFQLPA